MDIENVKFVEAINAISYPFCIIDSKGNILFSNRGFIKHDSPGNFFENILGSDRRKAKRKVKGLEKINYGSTVITTKYNKETDKKNIEPKSY